MSSDTFPNPKEYQFAEWTLFDEFYYPTRDIIGFGEELTVENLKESYSKGIFPWHIDGLPLPWFCPEKRAILEFEKLHIPKSLKKAFRNTKFTFTIDKDFESVISNCSVIKRSHEKGTWITDEFIKTYIDFHNGGNAHSVEVWGEGENLVGGLYGVDSGGVFCGESMFFKESNASKFALLHLIEHLKTKGSTWLDIQMMTPHFKILGAHEVDRTVFLDKLSIEQEKQLKLF
jgi:leucyl/phenylalanyl-tRNA--protein transferase